MNLVASKVSHEDAVDLLKLPVKTKMTQMIGALVTVVTDKDGRDIVIVDTASCEGVIAIS